MICDQDRLDQKGCHGAPDWVIEIMSPSSVKMDSVRKVKLYQEAGVREYWIVDWRKKQVEIYLNDDKEDGTTYFYLYKTVTEKKQRGFAACYVP